MPSPGRSSIRTGFGADPNTHSAERIIARLREAEVLAAIRQNDYKHLGPHSSLGAFDVGPIHGPVEMSVRCVGGSAPNFRLLSFRKAGERTPRCSESGSRLSSRLVHKTGAGRQGRKPRNDEFVAYGQACIAMAEGIIGLLQSHGCWLFAALIPRVADPVAAPVEYLRKDHVFLFERFFYFLEERRDTGLLVMDGSDKGADRQFVRRMERYFTQTLTGRQRTQWIVPSPFFVESDMTYGVQVADLCIYCLNWGYRRESMTEPTRPEIEPFAWLLERLIWHGEGYREGEVFKTHSVVYVPDPYEARSAKKKEVRPSGPP